LAPILTSDVLTFARALRAKPRGVRRLFARLVLCIADGADLYRKVTGRHHPEFGNGSLHAACVHLREPLADLDFECDGDLEALGAAVDALLDWRRRKRAGNRNHRLKSP
jgi:hypothetical protein